MVFNFLSSTESLLTIDIITNELRTHPMAEMKSERLPLARKGKMAEEHFPSSSDLEECIEICTTADAAKYLLEISAIKLSALGDAAKPALNAIKKFAQSKQKAELFEEEIDDWAGEQKPDPLEAAARNLATVLNGTVLMGYALRDDAVFERGFRHQGNPLDPQARTDIDLLMRDWLNQYYITGDDGKLYERDNAAKDNIRRDEEGRPKTVTRNQFYAVMEDSQKGLQRYMQDKKVDFKLRQQVPSDQKAAPVEKKQAAAAAVQEPGLREGPSQPH